MSPRARRIAVLALPVLGLALFVLRSELVVTRGRVYELTVEGYDPRDLLRGHYLQYRIRWNLAGPACTDARCCLCVHPDASPVDPRVSARACDAVRDCQSFIRGDGLEHLQKFFVPQERAASLERAVQGRRASVLVAVAPDGRALVTDLLVDGVSWRAQTGRGSSPAR